MKIKEEYPPNIELIELALGKSKDAIYTYGDTIYNPHKRIITSDIEVHEGVHCKQQVDNPDYYTTKYLTDPEFRLECEVEAYGTQWQYIQDNVADSKLKYWLLEKMAFALSGQDYGSLVSYGKAESLIRNYGK